MTIIIGIVVGYLIGGFPTGIILCRVVKGVDPRTLGSGSSGATNVSRVLGRHWALLVLVLDMLKGFLPVIGLAPLLCWPDPQFHVRVALGAGAIVGHVLTPYAGFRGGKGIATATGVLLALDYQSVIVSLGVWIAAFVPFRVVSVASLLAAISLPLVMILLGDRAVAVIGCALGVAVFMLYTHRENIRRLWHGYEKPIA